MSLGGLVVLMGNWALYCALALMGAIVCAWGSCVVFTLFYPKADMNPDADRRTPHRHVKRGFRGRRLSHGNRTVAGRMKGGL